MSHGAPGRGEADAATHGTLHDVERPVDSGSRPASTAAGPAGPSREPSLQLASTRHGGVRSPKSPSGSPDRLGSTRAGSFGEEGEAVGDFSVLSDGDGELVPRGLAEQTVEVVQPMGRGMMAMLMMEDSMESDVGADEGTGGGSFLRQRRSGRFSSGKASATAPLLEGVADESPKRQELSPSFGLHGGRLFRDGRDESKAGINIKRGLAGALGRFRNESVDDLRRALQRRGRLESAVESIANQRLWDDTSIDWKIMIKESLYVAFLPLSLPVIIMMEGRHGLVNRDISLRDGTLRGIWHCAPAMSFWLCAISLSWQARVCTDATRQALVADLLNLALLFLFYVLAMGQRYAYMPKPTYAAFNSRPLSRRQRMRWLISSWMNPDLTCMLSQITTASLRNKVSISPEDFFISYSRGRGEDALRRVLFPHRRLLDVLCACHDDKATMTMRDGKCPALLLTTSIALQSYACEGPLVAVVPAVVLAAVKTVAVTLAMLYVDDTFNGEPLMTQMYAIGALIITGFFEAYMYAVLLMARTTMGHRRDSLRYVDELITVDRHISVRDGSASVVNVPPVLAVERAENVEAWNKMRQLITGMGRHFVARHEAAIFYIFLVVVANTFVLVMSLFKDPNGTPSSELYGVAATSVQLASEALILLGIIASLLTKAIEANSFSDSAVRSLRDRRCSVTQRLEAVERELFRREVVEPALLKHRGHTPASDGVPDIADDDAQCMADKMVSWNTLRSKPLRQCGTMCLRAHLVELRGARDVVDDVISDMQEENRRYPITIFGVRASPALLRLVGTVIVSIATAALKPVVQKAVEALLGTGAQK